MGILSFFSRQAAPEIKEANELAAVAQSAHSVYKHFEDSPHLLSQVVDDHAAPLTSALGRFISLVKKGELKPQSQEAFLKAAKDLIDAYQIFNKGGFDPSLSIIADLAEAVSKYPGLKSAFADRKSFLYGNLCEGFYNTLHRKEEAHFSNFMRMAKAVYTREFSYAAHKYRSELMQLNDDFEVVCDLARQTISSSLGPSVADNFDERIKDLKEAGHAPAPAAQPG